LSEVEAAFDQSRDDRALRLGEVIVGVCRFNQQSGKGKLELVPLPTGPFPAVAPVAGDPRSDAIDHRFA
jgi:hypothetical protein